MYSKDDFSNIGIDNLHSVLYYYSMGIFVQKIDNLVKLLEGMSLLDDRDRERIIKAVDTLDFADKKVKKEVFCDCPDLKSDTPTANNDDKI